MKLKIFARLGVWLDDHWIDAGLALCSVLFAGCTLALRSEVLDVVLPDSTHHALIKRWTLNSIWLILLFGIVLWVFNLRRSKRITVLETENETLSREKDLLVDNVDSLIKGYLLNLATKKLDFGARDRCDDRISLFSHDEDGGEFVLVGRYSDNPTLHKTQRRSQYPDTQGCLARAWQNGSDFANDFPSPQDSLEEYVALQEASYGFPAIQARQLTMKSRLYYVYRIMDTRNRNPIAAIVVESTEVDRFTRNQLDQVFNNQEREFMSEILEVLQPHLRIPSVATKEGY